MAAASPANIGNIQIYLLYRNSVCVDGERAVKSRIGGSVAEQRGETF